MKKVKKYYPGTSGLVYDNSKSVGVLAPQKEDPNKFSTGKFLFPEQKTLGKIVDNKVMSQDYLSSKGPSFMDKAGSFMGNYGDIIGSVGTSIASLINANKKQDPTGRPYKKGTNMIKYQEGTKSAKNMEYILEQNRINNAMNTILVANAANAKRNAELNSRVAPKKLEGKKANVKTDSLKTNKPSLVKYQAGAEEIIGPGPLDNLPQMSPEQLKAFNAYDSKKEIAEAIERVNKMGAPVSPLTPRMASIPTAQIPAMSPKMSSNVAPVQKQSRRERKAENRKLEAMARAPITYNENAFVGPSNEELQLGRLREDAQSARKTYEARLAGESARSAYEAKQKGTPITDALLKRSMSSQAFKETMSPYKSFKDMTPAQQKQYRAGMASGREFTVEGIGKYAAVSKSEKKPLAKIRKGEDSWTEAQWKDFYKKRNNPIQGQELVRMKNNPYAMAGFNIPFNQPVKQSVNGGKKQKPATNIPSPIMDYKKINKINDIIDSDRKIFKEEKRAFPVSDYYKPFFDSYYGKTIRRVFEIQKNPSASKVEKITQNKNTVDNTIQREREAYKKRKEQEQTNLKQQGINAMEKLKKENPQAYDFQMRLNAKREALKKQK